ncbi:Uncharacterised protein [Mycolicibacterium vanbaalenii]|uniref:Uncharacterized protein n=1 Tax=Mycolicibacterium vanbaalenii TaxID=110539 RepID=A0A5S9R474_MYCVN|nr:hypothetical protein [Mycolicibacterium vanbaalenii]CAA0127864.1 Uncharacterised protein [Mycolicibacterium vanbaalenii]
MKARTTTRPHATRRGHGAPAHAGHDADIASWQTLIVDVGSVDRIDRHTHRRPRQALDSSGTAARAGDAGTERVL